ncbi:MAG TPA: protein translocase subunit SecD, partial [bacterium]|nr:protein translocase subunit SecD [bacterium]
MARAETSGMGMRFKGLFYLALVAGCVALAWPTLQAYRPGGDPTQYKNKVNLGLDLQGGMFLDLEVEAQQAADHTLDRLAQELEDALIDRHTDYLGVDRRPGAVLVRLA